MPIYKAPTRDTRFVINELLELESYGNLPGFEAATPDTVDAIVEEGRPLLLGGDPAARTWSATAKAARATTTAASPPRPASRTPTSNTSSAAGARCRCRPNMAGRACRMCSASRSRNISPPPTTAFAMYPGLTNGAVAAINVVGTDEQKQTYLPKMISGEWRGTMNLTEPHCGTDLGLIKTKRRARRRTAATRSPAPRSSSPPASTT